MSRRLQRTISLSITTLFLAFSMILLTLLLPTGWKLFSVQSGSMEPAIGTGDLVLVNSVPASEYRIGDVITYADPDNPKQTITHRIADIREGQQRVFITQGDANSSADRAFNESMVVGRQKFTIPYLGHVVDFIFTIPGLLLIIWLPALWIMAGETKRLTDYYRRMQKYLAPGFAPQIIKPSYGHTHKTLAIAVASIALITMAGLSGTVFAVVSPAATLSSNIIGIAGDGIPEPPSPPVTCSNNTNINVRSTTNQSASSGRVSNNGNTNGGSATSGNASNSSSTSVNVQVNNGNCVPT